MAATMDTIMITNRVTFMEPRLADFMALLDSATCICICAEEFAADGELVLVLLRVLTMNAGDELTPFDPYSFRRTVFELGFLCGVFVAAIGDPITIDPRLAS
jgi:hypothetical protein